MINVKRGDIFYVDLDPIIGSEQGGIRPAVIIQNDSGNIHSTTTIIASITRKEHKDTKTLLPVHVEIEHPNLPFNSIILLEQIRTVSQERLREKIGKLSNQDIDKMNAALIVSLDLECYNMNILGY